MKTQYIKKVLASASVAFVALSSVAQTTSSGYFLEGFNQRYQLNPAFAPERNVYLAVPALNNIQLGLNSNVGIKNFLYESKQHPGQLTTFMSRDVNRQDFLDNIPDMARMNMLLNMDMLSIGIGGEKGFTTFNVKIRNNEDFGIPKSFFGFMKSALSTGEYSIQDLNANVTTYMEVALVHSRKIGENLRVGLGLKFLDGIEYADINIDQMDAVLGEKEWKVRTNGSLRVCVPGQEIKYNDEDKTIDLGEFNYETPSSYGFAVDLGAEYDMKDLVEGLKLSASVTDLGMISWKNISHFATDNREFVTFDGFTDYDVMSDGGNDEADNLGDELKGLVNLYDKGQGNESIALCGTIRAGAEYQFPFADWLSVGELLTMRVGNYDYFETRTSVCLSPCGWFDFTANAGYTSWGGVAGAMINLHPRGINFFLAVDGMAATVNRQYIPVDDVCINMSLGLSLAFGQKKDR